MPLVGEHGNAATFEDMNAFETRLEDIVSSRWIYYTMMVVDIDRLQASSATRRKD